MDKDTIRITGEVHLEDMTSRDVLEKQYVQSIFSATTPFTFDVNNRRFFVAANTAARTLTDFVNGAPGQRIYIRGDGQTTIQNGGPIFTNTGANKLLAVNKVYKFTYFETMTGANILHQWIEDE